jgi:hypothetical protein
MVAFTAHHCFIHFLSGPKGYPFPSSFLNLQLADILSVAWLPAVTGYESA